MHSFIQQREWAYAHPEGIASGMTWTEMFILFDIVSDRTKEAQRINHKGALRRATQRRDKAKAAQATRNVRKEDSGATIGPRVSRNSMGGGRLSTENFRGGGSLSTDNFRGGGSLSTENFRASWRRGWSTRNATVISKPIFYPEIKLFKAIVRQIARREPNDEQTNIFQLGKKSSAKVGTAGDRRL